MVAACQDNCSDNAAMQQFDVVIIGAGAAGLFCAGVAGQRGLKVLLLDHAARVAEKIRISGGGRCNFTNRDIDVREPHKHFISANPKFCRSALSRYTPAHFIALLDKHGVPHHEKHKGQMFCDRRSQDLIDVLLRECEVGAAGGSVTRWQPCALQALRHRDAATHPYEADTHLGLIEARAVVVATGSTGLSPSRRSRKSRVRPVPKYRCTRGLTECPQLISATATWKTAATRSRSSGDGVQRPSAMASIRS